jgi:peptide deformylase
MFGTKELGELVERMLGALDAERDGVALAAPQIGVSLRIFVVRYDRLHEHPAGVVPEPEVGVYINPEFVKASRRRIEMDEGCLSVRRVYGKTVRYERATVQARLPDGNVFTRGGGGILAQIFQHETDHLDGVLFTDHAHDMVEIREEDWEDYKQGRMERNMRDNAGGDVNMANDASTSPDTD